MPEMMIAVFCALNSRFHAVAADVTERALASPVLVGSTIHQFYDTFLYVHVGQRSAKDSRRSHCKFYVISLSFGVFLGRIRIASLLFTRFGILQKLPLSC
jgi:hypothetical protein